MSDAVLCDRCDEAVPTDEWKRGQRASILREVTSQSATKYRSTRREYELCADCALELDNWLQADED